MKRKCLTGVIVLSIFSSFLAGCGLLPAKNTDQFNNRDSIEFKLSDNLYLAIDYGFPDLAEETVKDGVNINKFPKDLCVETEFDNISSPLLRAVLSNNLDIAKILINNGADVQYKDSKNRNILMYNLVWSKPMENIQFLLDNGISINDKSKDGYTALDYAFQSGYDEYQLDQIVIFLIDNGAKITPTTLKVALEYKPHYYKLVRRLLETIKSDGKDPGINPALEAAILGNNEVLNQYIKQDNISDDLLLTIGYYCAAFCNTENMELLIEKGIPVDEKELDDRRFTLLFAAATCNNIDILKYLIEEKEANIDWSADDKTAISLAVGNGNYDMVKYLWQKGAEIKNDLSMQKYELSLAARNGDLQMADLLISLGYPMEENDLEAASETAIDYN